MSSAQAATLTATTGSTSKSVSLQLNAAVPTLSVNASSVSFGSVVINSATTQTVTLTSSGTAPVTVNSILVSGSGFSASPVSLPATLNPGQTLNITLTFDPITTGTASGQFTVTSNSSTNPTTTVSLCGTGDSHQVQLSWVAPNGSTDPVMGYNIYRAPGGTTSYARMNASVEVVTTFTDTSAQAGASYVYVVKSVDANGTESTPSNTISVTIP